MADTSPGLTLKRFLPYRLSVVANLVSDEVAKAYQARFGLKIPEWRVLANIAERGIATQAQLVDLTVMDKMTVSRAVAGLTARDLVSRRRAADRRTNLLQLTATGQALYAEVVPLALDIEANLLAGISPADRETLDRVLDQLRNCLKP